MKNLYISDGRDIYYFDLHEKLVNPTELIYLGWS